MSARTLVLVAPFFLFFAFWVSMMLYLRRRGRFANPRSPERLDRLRRRARVMVAVGVILAIAGVLAHVPTLIAAGAVFALMQVVLVYIAGWHR